MRKIDDLQKAIAAISGLLRCPFLSPATIANLEQFKAELEQDLRFILEQQSDAAAWLGHLFTPSFLSYSSNFTWGNTLWGRFPVALSLRLLGLAVYARFRIADQKRNLACATTNKEAARKWSRPGSSLWVHHFTTRNTSCVPLSRWTLLPVDVMTLPLVAFVASVARESP